MRGAADTLVTTAAANQQMIAEKLRAAVTVADVTRQLQMSEHSFSGVGVYPIPWGWEWQVCFAHQAPGGANGGNDGACIWRARCTVSITNKYPTMEE
jgi:hypothetical protein